MSQLHKRFSSDQVKELLARYVKNEIERQAGKFEGLPLLFESFIDPCSQNLYIPIRNRKGGVRIFLRFHGKKALGPKEAFQKYRKSQA